MNKAVTALNWADFMNGRVVEKQRTNTTGVVIKYGSTLYALMLPVKVLAATTSAAHAGSWAKIFASILGVSDWLCVGIFIFSGATWMFNNRSKAIEMMIGGSAGYYIIRHSKEIQEWLASL